MKQYQNLLRECMEFGTEEGNRTKYAAKVLVGAMLRFDLRKRFPMMTLRQQPVKAGFAEMIGMWRGVTSAAEFRALGCGFWDGNANENEAWLANPFRKGEDDLGPVYGAQWRKWQAFKFIATDPDGDLEGQRRGAKLNQHMFDTDWKYIASDFTDEHTVYRKEIDQLRNCFEKILSNPDDRRILMHAWNPAVMDEIALPACHLLYEFIPSRTNKTLSLVVFIRSWDLYLGAPANITNAALMLETMARLTGLQAAELVIQAANAHIYENSYNNVNILLERDPIDCPTRLAISDDVPSEVHPDNWQYFDRAHPSHFKIEGYESHPALERVAMAV